ncbi:unnamed protein product [Aphis gossypii]|uniref:Cysteine/serine-rich nuclear protein N-terminal domain-containing protein n=1 Tax=Aphis gossypii TaxID=80765 RepID=A0A9P0NIW5_APHGO|nr:unnamed protein product [Aphis gossypii]
MEFLITNESDEVSILSQTDEPTNAQLHNDDIKHSNVVNTDKVNNEEISPVSKTLSDCLIDAPKSLSDSEFRVQNMLFNMKSEEFNTNSDDKTSIDCNIKPINSDIKNVCMSIPSSNSNYISSNETQVLSSTNESTYSDINNIFTINKKRGFSIEEISKDETSQNSQSMSTYSNDYTCFLSEQTDVTSNLTPFKRSNSYYFDSPVKKLCITKLPTDEKTNEALDSINLYSNKKDNKIFSGFTSIQNDLEVDCLQDRYDGSDSGFGSELAEDKNTGSLDVAVSTPNVSYTTDFTLNQESSFEDLQRTSNEFLSAMEVLKPKFSDSILDTGPLDVRNNYGIVKGILKRNKPVNYDVLTSDITTVKKRKNINFANVTVFYFPRVQGFTCVPSQGGSTLGMTRVHSASRVFSLPEYIAEQRRIRRNLIQLSQSEVSGTNSDDSDSDVGAADVYSESDADVDSDSNGSFLQPVPTRQRRALLKAAGVDKIDSSEKDDCKSIRLSREFCGCLCRGFCDPDTCACFQAGITCQVDRMNFPCGCTVDGCGNSVGRIEFNPTRVRKHFIHTIMRLEIKKREAQEEEHCNKLAMTSPLVSNFSYHDSRHIQPYYQPQQYENNLNDYNYHSFLPVYDGNHIAPESSTQNNYQLNNSQNLYEPYQPFPSAFVPLSQDKPRGLSILDNKPETFTDLLHPYNLQSIESTDSLGISNIPSTLVSDSFNLESENLGEIIKNTMVESVNS